MTRLSEAERWIGGRPRRLGCLLAGGGAGSSGASVKCFACQATDLLGATAVPPADARRARDKSRGGLRACARRSSRRMHRWRPSPAPPRELRFTLGAFVRLGSSPFRRGRESGG